MVVGVSVCENALSTFVGSVGKTQWYQYHIGFEKRLKTSELKEVGTW